MVFLLLNGVDIQADDRLVDMVVDAAAGLINVQQVANLLRELSIQGQA